MGHHSSHLGLPPGEPYTTSQRATMEFDYSYQLTYDPVRPERLAFEQLRVSRLANIAMWRSH